MTYIDYLNSFNLWLESNALPANSQLMFFKFLNVFNRAGWPKYVQVDTLRLMMMIDTSDKRTAYRARDGLVESNFISYEKGSKGKPSRYYLLSQNATVSATVNATLSGTENGTQNGTRIYTNNINNNTIEKTKNKTKTIYDSDFGKVYAYYSDNIEVLPNDMTVAGLSSWYKKMGAECCIKAIDIAIKNGVLKWRYIERTLENAYKDGIRTVKDWDRVEQDYKARKEQNSFIPPTEEELRAYCESIGRYIDIKAFLNHYNAVGWKRGHTQIADWRPLVMSWADMNPEDAKRKEREAKRRKMIKDYEGETY